MFLSFLTLHTHAQQLLNHPIPLLPNKTLDGRTIDHHYYNGHLTIVSFMYIGCLPCMNEISVLNRINDEYAATGKVQVLCVARQMKDQMILFNSTNKSDFSLVKKALGADSIRYAIQPACKDAKSNIEISGDGESKGVYLKSECTTIEETFGVSSYPTIFYVDKNAIVRKIHKGGPPRNNDTAFYKMLKHEIDSLLVATK